MCICPSLWFFNLREFYWLIYCVAFTDMSDLWFLELFPTKYHETSSLRSSPESSDSSTAEAIKRLVFLAHNSPKITAIKKVDEDLFSSLGTLWSLLCLIKIISLSRPDTASSQWLGAINLSTKKFKQWIFLPTKVTTDTENKRYFGSINAN